ncbi:MAG TPA: cytochrome c oxidase assembly protein [Candidatus Competibacteraceae bacterium]|nr:cytochrome c oxidase assembly protein [Candidatus Competibacteraceae bacterium]MCP5134201.1 cytochrome c oxidase assembly protein [Gammaproteobacteria bacterium]HPF58739.1 cytochrome c oxidase assembly protein [Candidatus Competibacteraceae bacterium]HRY18232.1 cytochrome c oxidase assembly protein [Candidatus Competibacteraceae bacterium]
MNKTVEDAPNSDPVSPDTDRLRQANRRLVRRMLFITVAMFGFGFAMVPIYDVLCQVTGLNGKTGGRVVAAEPMKIDELRTVTVEFVANLNVTAPWEFSPQVDRMTVHPGQFYQTHFHARNLTNQPLVGQAIPSVSPGLAASHFQKIECFCFNRQQFQAGESKEMPVTFRIDPDLPPDVRTVTLSYTFFRLDEASGS